MTDRVQAFERLRPRMRGLAYRMLGSLDDAEDAVQEAFLRWHRTEVAEIRSPEAWLTTVVTRLCLDRLRAAAAEREAYVGPWLPEPMPVEDRMQSPDRVVELASDLSLAFLLVLERLSPEERAAFLLREVFDCGYPDIARALDRSEAACRQMVHRARERVRQDRPRFAVTEAAHRRLVTLYLEAVRTRDAARLAALFAEDATIRTDGGGKAWAARKVIHGADRIVRLTMGLARKFGDRLTAAPIMVNGRTGVATYLDGCLHSVTEFDTNGLRILSLLRVLNPDKLRAFPQGAPPQVGLLA